MSTRRPKRKLLAPIPPPIDPITHHPVHPADLLEVVGDRVQHCWPWPFTDEVSIKEAADLAGVSPDHPLMHGVVMLLRRHLHKRLIVKEMGLPATANARAEIADILRGAIAFSDACRRLSSETFSLFTEGGSDPALVRAMGEMPQIEWRAQQLIAADNYARANNPSGALPTPKGGAPRKARSILIGRIRDVFEQHLGAGAKGRRQFTEMCLRAIGEATEGGPTEYNAIEKAGQRERARRDSNAPLDPRGSRRTKPT